MNLTNLVTRAGNRTLFACTFLASTLFATSCQKDSSLNSATNISIPATSDTLKSLAAAPLATVTLASSYRVVGPIYLAYAHDLTISGDYINGGSSPCIYLVNCYNIHITRSKLVNSSNVGVSLYNCTNIVVDSCYIANVSTGVYANSCRQIQVKANDMLNMMGPMPRGQFVQFNNVNGTGNRISNNHLQNIMGQSRTEDGINIYKSNGTAADPIYIMANWIVGGGPSTTGGGINLGEQGGSYQVASYNTLVNPGQYGMCVSGGSNIHVLSNNIYSQSQWFSNVGIYYWNQSKLPSSAITVSGNKVNFMSGKLGGISNNYFIGPGNPTPSGWNTNVWGASISASILPATIINYR
jgi:hypothetical protein